MTVDYLSSLNIGSGLNSTEIIDAIVEAERAPKASIIENSETAKNLQISSLGLVKSDVESFQTNIALSQGVTGISVNNTGASSSIVITDPGSISEFSNTLEISQLATSHTLVFGDYSTQDFDIGQGTISFAFGTWDSDGDFTANADRTATVVTINSTNDTLSGLRDAINDANIQISASIIETSDSTYSLVLKSREGADHAIQMTVTEDSSDTGLSSFSYTSVSASTETIAASDATLELDGVSITRDTNTITDLIPGASLTLASTTSSAETISASYDTDLALLALEAVIENFNTLQSSLTSLYSRGLDGAEAGGLAGDPLIRSMISQFRNYTTTAIEGFGDTSIYPTEFGVTTNQDGTLSVDEDTFTSMYESNPDAFASIVLSRVTTGSTLVSGSMTGDSYTAGTYAFAIDSDGDATLDSVDLTEYTDGSFVVTSGEAVGLQIDVSNSGTDTNIYVGRSLLDILSNYATGILASDGLLEEKLTDATEDLEELTTDLTNLDARIAKVRARYVEQFAAMNKTVASLKETEKSLENMMTAWTAAMKR